MLIYIDSFPFPPHSLYRWGGVCTMFVTLPELTTYDSDLLHYANILVIPNFQQVKMRDELGKTSSLHECGIINLNKHNQLGSHWTCYFRDGVNRYYFDSYGQPPPRELLEYLKTPLEMNQNAAVIHRSAVMVQHIDTDECGSLCLYVLKKLSDGEPFPEILTFLLKRFATSPTPRLVIKV